MSEIIDHMHDHEEHDHHFHKHDHDHDHEHAHDHEHDHSHSQGILSTVMASLHIGGHDHDHGSLAADPAIKNNSMGIRTIYLAMFLLGATTVLQVIVFAVSGSVSLLGDTVHNFGDAINSIPLLFAFWLAGRAANKRYTYGYGRLEDLAGVLIVISIGFSAFYILWESVSRLFNPVPLSNLGWVAVAAVVGFLGNELAANVQLHAGRRMGSEAMVANGLHARVDGLTSLAVLVAAIGAWLGYPILDALIGIVMGIVILFITWSAARSMWYRLMDAVDPTYIEKAETEILEHPEVREIQRLQMRWEGHELRAEAAISIDADLSTEECKKITEHICHHLYHEVPNLSCTTIEVEPWHRDGQKYIGEASHHRA